MYPILTKIGPLTLYTYGLFMAIAFFSAISFIYYETKKEGLNSDKIVDLGFYVILAGVLGARLLYILMYPSEYISTPIKIFKVWEGGLVFYGGIIGGLMATIFLIKKYSLPQWKMLDIFAPALLLGQAIGRLGCFMAGCCYGKPSTLAWAVIFSNKNTLAPHDIFLHPTQLYHSLINFLILFILLYILKRRRKFIGQIFCLYLILYPIGRFIIEFFRGDSITYLIGSLNLTQGVSLIILLGSLYLYFWRKKTL